MTDEARDSSSGIHHPSFIFGSMALEILVYIETQSGRVTRPAWEAIAAAQRLGGDLGAPVVAVVIGSDLAALAQEVAGTEVQGIVTVESPLLADYTADGYAGALAEVIATRQPRLVVFSHTYQVRDFAPKLGAALDGGFVSDCLGYRKEGERLIFVRQVFQGKFCADVEFTGEGPNLVSFQASAFREDAATRGTAPAKISAFIPTLTADTIRAKPGERFREAKQAVDLTQAEVIVAVGRGIKAVENLELAKKLADSLGGEMGASRPICDSGWLAMDRQIGSSGQTVAPKLYIGLGVSGAIQHQVGMKGSRVVVAINKDKEAPIFEVATYGIVGDLFEVVPPLIEEIKKIRS
jgi:electron transfer flavoprotein alpha subunit